MSGGDGWIGRRVTACVTTDAPWYARKRQTRVTAAQNAHVLFPAQAAVLSFASAHTCAAPCVMEVNDPWKGMYVVAPLREQKTVFALATM